MYQVKFPKHDDDVKKLINSLKNKAVDSNTKAMTTLAFLYLDGDWVQQNFNEAFYFANKAARKEDAYGLLLTANMYYQGIGVPVDYCKATSFYEQVLQIDEDKKYNDFADIKSSAELLLSTLYYQGLGVKQDRSKLKEVMNKDRLGFYGVYLFFLLQRKYWFPFTTDKIKEWQEISPKYDPDHIRALNYSYCNRKIIEQSKLCGCYDCKKIFTPQDLSEWDWIDGGNTALCPYCATDTVIGDAAGFKITKEFLRKMP